MAKNQAKAKQYREAEPLPFENVQKTSASVLMKYIINDSENEAEKEK